MKRIPLMHAAFILLAVGACVAPQEDETATTEAPLTNARTLRVDYQVQETSYWCGPAATRIALSARRAAPSQQTLARQLGTTTNGTDHIGLVRDVLNRQLGPEYKQVLMADDPPTPAQKSTLWADITNSIDHGYAVVTNIVAPPHDHPPGYPNRTIYHYFTVTGYDAQARKVFVSDPASFSGQRQYWLTFDQLASLVPPKGYAALDGTTCDGGKGVVIGAINQRYLALGGCRSTLGAPQMNERKTPDGVGHYSVFDRGSIYWTEATGAHEVLGRIRDAWRDTGWEAGPLGYPTSGEHDVPGGRESTFEHGSIKWTRATNETSVTLAR